MDEKIAQIVSVFRSRGCRITEQRRQLVSLIVHNPECSCKELYYMARNDDNTIGRATVYRTVRTLEEFGFIRTRSITLL